MPKLHHFPRDPRGIIWSKVLHAVSPICATEADYNRCGHSKSGVAALMKGYVNLFRPGLGEI